MCCILKDRQVSLQRISMSKTGITKIKDRVLTIEVDHTHEQDIAIIRLNGDLDLESFPSLKEALNSKAASGTDCLIINLEKVRVISSSAVGALMHQYKSMEKNNRKMILVSLSATVLQVLDLLNLKTFFPQAATEEEAIEKLLS